MSRLSRLVVLVLFITLIGYADTQSFVPGTTYIVDPSLTGFSTSGDGMVGMNVTAYFASGSVSSSWAVTGVGAGAASVAGRFSLSETGDTFSNLWTLTNLSGDMMSRLTIEGVPGKTVFDVCLNAPCDGDSSTGTPGSARGWTFERVGGTYAGGIDATYINKVAIIGSAPVGDLWTDLDLAFSDGVAGAITLTWVTDTDSVPELGSITPSVPEPSSWILLGSCAFLLAARFRRRVA